MKRSKNLVIPSPPKQVTKTCDQGNSFNNFSYETGTCLLKKLNSILILDYKRETPNVISTFLHKRDAQKNVTTKSSLSDRGRHNVVLAAQSSDDSKALRASHTKSAKCTAGLTHLEDHQ